MCALGRTSEAIASLREAVRLKPNYVEAHLDLALALSAWGDHAAAEKSCRDALRLQPGLLLAKQTLATELCALDRAGDAERLLRQALALGVRDPRQAAALEYGLALALKQQDRFHEALALFDSAQAKVPDIPGVDFNRGNVFQQLGRLEEALACYRRAASRDPAHAESQSCYALLATLTGDFATARAAAKAALAIDPHQPLARIAQAIADIDTGDFPTARRMLDDLLADPRTASDRQTSFALGFAADAWDRREEAAAAFALYRASNERRRGLLAASFEGARVIADVNRLSEHFARCDAWAASTPKRPRAAMPTAHVFVLGFMRSGTTLLETILSTHPDVVDSDEIEFLTGPARAFLLDEAGLLRLAALDEREAEHWRAAYWKEVGRAGIAVGGKVFVDKMPFNSLRLPLIARLFPEAKIIFAVRDPRDVVLSCFRRRFNPTPFSYEFLRLEDCAQFYAALMALSDLYRRKLPLAILEHFYEHMIADFDTALRAVCAFIGIAWTEEMRDFRHAAQSIDRRSASAAQVRRGLYPEAAGQWRRYRTELAPILPVLAPSVTRFAYSPI